MNIGRDALKLQIPRGEAPRDEEFPPRDLQFQCIPSDVRAVVFLYCLLNRLSNLLKMHVVVVVVDRGIYFRQSTLYHTISTYRNNPKLGTVHHSYLVMLKMLIYLVK